MNEPFAEVIKPYPPASILLPYDGYVKSRLDAVEGHTSHNGRRCAILTFSVEEVGEALYRRARGSIVVLDGKDMNAQYNALRALDVMASAGVPTRKIFDVRDRIHKKGELFIHDLEPLVGSEIYPMMESAPIEIYDVQGDRKAPPKVRWYSSARSYISRARYEAERARATHHWPLSAEAQAYYDEHSAHGTARKS